MAFVPPHDRVMERSTSNSQTVFAVTGAADASRRAFSSFMSIGDTTIGGVVEDGVAFASGKLTYSASNQVTVDSSSFGGETVGTFSSTGTKKVFMGLPAAHVLMMDGAQSLAAALKVQARSNISAAWFAAHAARNAAINGAVDVSQELGTTGATLANNTVKYIADAFQAMYNHAANTAVVTSAQLAAASFPSVLAGFAFGHQIKATTAITSPASGDFAKHRQPIGGYRIARWGWGATGAMAIVVAFELYSTASGTAFVKLSNSDQSRCYYHEITVAAGWNFVAFTVPGDTTGTWQATTSIGLTFEVFVSGKETTPASSLDAWGSTNKVQTTNSTNLLGTNNNLTILTGLFIDAGQQLPIAGELPLLMRSFDQEYTLCKKFLQYRRSASTSDHIAMLQGISTTGAGGPLWTFEVEMWSAPTVTVSATGDLSVSNSAGTFSACTSHAFTAGTQSVKDIIAVGSAILTAACATIIAFNTASGFIKADSRL